MEIKYKRGNNVKSALIDYENLTDMCYGCGQQDPKFENCPLFSKSFSIKVEKRLSDLSMPKDPNAEINHPNSMANENWVETKPQNGLKCRYLGKGS